MSPKPLVQIIGSLNSDFVVRTPRVPEAGETITAQSVTIGPGGKGANQAVACGRAGFTTRAQSDLDVEMIGAVGANDVHVSSLIKPILHESGVGTEGVLEIENMRTGTSTILVEDSGENRILFYPGANYEGLRDAQKVVDIATRSGERWPDVVVLQGEIPYATTVELLKQFNSDANKTAVVLNPAPVFEEGVPREALKGLAVLIVNETECVLLARLMELASFEAEADPDLSQAQLDGLAEKFLGSIGVRNFIVTLGSKGAYYATQSKKSGIIPASKVEKVVDTTAAGDTFAGYFATAFAKHIASGESSEGFDIAEAIAVANRAAGRCVQKPGSMQSVPFKYDL